MIDLYPSAPRDGLQAGKHLTKPAQNGWIGGKLGLQCYQPLTSYSKTWGHKPAIPRLTDLKSP